MKGNKFTKLKSYKVYSQNSLYSILDTYASSPEQVVGQIKESLVGKDPDRVDIIFGSLKSLAYFTYKRQLYDMYVCPEDIIEYKIIQS
jgi:hypothetical protein